MVTGLDEPAKHGTGRRPVPNDLAPAMRPLHPMMREEALHSKPARPDPRLIGEWLDDLQPTTPMTVSHLVRPLNHLMFAPGEADHIVRTPDVGPAVAEVDGAGREGQGDQDSREGPLHGRQSWP